MVINYDVDLLNGVADQPLLERLERTGDNLRFFGYSTTHDKKVHTVSLKVNIPAHMKDVISTTDIEGEIRSLIQLKRSIKHTVEN